MGSDFVVTYFTNGSKKVFFLQAHLIHTARQIPIYEIVVGNIPLQGLRVLSKDISAVQISRNVTSASFLPIRMLLKVAMIHICPLIKTVQTQKFFTVPLQLQHLLLLEQRAILFLRLYARPFLLNRTKQQHCR